MSMQAEVVGGGIGGLAVAMALGRAGWRVTVREKDDALPTTGTALAIWPATLRALDELGVGEEVRQTGRRQEAGEFRRPDGRRIAKLDLARLERRTGDQIYLLSRPALLSILHHGAVREADVRFGTGVDRLGSEAADLVVVADGVFSRGREQLFGTAYRARYSGSTAWRGVIENMPTGTFVETWGRGVKFGVTPQEGERTNWFASAPTPQGATAPDGEVNLLRQMFGTWAPPVRTVVDALQEPAVLRHDVYVTPPLPSFVRGTTVLIGDAAHAMLPDLGRGDAVTLAHCLRDGPDVPAALRAYDRQRRPATQRLARMSHVASRMSHVGRALPLRDRVLWAALLAGPPG
jgi:2-polyprenyl-6-methoxyphenol hydroxylase-like FAD-dependent oxidoreductase